MVYFFFLYKFIQYRSYVLVMVDLHDLFSSLLYTGIMGFILNFGGEKVIEVFLGMKYLAHSSSIAQLHFKLKRRRKHHLYMQDCHSSGRRVNMHSKSAFFQNLSPSRLK